MTADFDLTKFKALSFDCYGTLIDWEAGILDALGPLGKRAGVSPDVDRLSTNGSDLAIRDQAGSPTIVFTSMKSARPHLPPSRPLPDCL